MRKALVLLSGGLDSSVLYRMAVFSMGIENVLALNVNYGQKHICERDCARWQVSKVHDIDVLDVTGDGTANYWEVDLSEVFKFNKNCSALLTGSTKEIAHESYADQLRHTDIVSAYVPYRNGLMLSYATAVAYQYGCDVVEYAAHADDAIRRANGGAAYPDCTEEFIKAQAAAIWEGSGHKVDLYAPLREHTKAEVVREGLSVGMTQEDFDHTHSCYEGVKGGCGTCGTCRDRAEALHANGLKDNGR